MKKLLIPAFLMLVLRLSAQDAYHNALNTQLQTNYGLPAVTQWVLPNTETATLNGAANYGSTVTSITPTGQIFSQARRLVVAQGLNPWDAGHLYQNTSAIANGDKCLLIIWLRSPTPNAKVNIFAENNTTYFKEAYAAVNLSTDWKMYAVPFASTAGYALNSLNIGLHLAYFNQTIEVGGAAVLNYKNTVQLSQLPVLLNNDSYPGIEPNAPWRAEAAASIEQIRKANLTVEVRDLNGNPLPNAQVYLEMQQHEFKFGTAVVSSLFNGGSGQNDTYEQKLLNLDGLNHGFNELVFENDLKWPAWEQHWFSSWDDIAADVQWLKDHDISIRGHNLVWPGWGYSPSDLESNQGNPNYLRNRIRNHLISILGYPGIGTEMEDWDVLNEITQNNDYANALAGTPGYVTGRELYAQIFKQADSLAPSSKMYLNDYVAIEQGDSPTNGIALWKSHINELLAAGAPLEGIGFQGHIGASPTGMPRVKEIYDDFWATYGLEAKVTEYDISNLVPPQIQAQYMRDFLTITFAHPSLKGFMMWGFWDGAHWMDNAPIFNEDWTLKPSGEAFIDQIFHQWWTNASAQTPASGNVTLRGFRGKYRLRVACGNSIKEQDVVLDGDMTLTVNLNCTTRTREAENEIGFWTSPNLVSSQLEIRWESPRTPASLQIFNGLGQWVASAQKPAGQSYVFDTNTWPNGVYVVNADFNGQMVSRRIFVQR
ncbi:MAG: endo-1,4-beta-xylanase [Phycisphaerae bacterium]|nr:endo-1,4-beta-xylanase [Saprospiraceae bacterium]